MTFKTKLAVGKLMVTGLVLGLLTPIQIALAFGKCGYGQVPCENDRGCCVIGSEDQSDFASLDPVVESRPRQTIIGSAVTRGSVPGSCDFAPPSSSDAEANANQQANEFCSNTGLSAVRVTDLTYSSNLCVWGGLGYRYAHDVVYAQADYSCE
jgi:hypothetical protein